MTETPQVPVDPEDFRFQKYYPDIDPKLGDYNYDDSDDEIEPACTYTARVIYEHLTKNNIACQVYWIDSHAFVVLDSQQDEEDPYNMPLGGGRTPSVGEIRRDGELYTQELLAEDWGRL